MGFRLGLQGASGLRVQDCKPQLRFGISSSGQSLNPSSLRPKCSSLATRTLTIGTPNPKPQTPKGFPARGCNSICSFLPKLRPCVWASWTLNLQPYRYCRGVRIQTPIKAIILSRTDLFFVVVVAMNSSLLSRTGFKESMVISQIGGTPFIPRIE